MATTYPVIGMTISFAFAAFLAALGVWSIKTGRMLTRGGIIRKEEFPIAFKAGLWTCWIVAVILSASGFFQLRDILSR